MSELAHNNQESQAAAFSESRPTFLMIGGALPEGRRFMRPLMIQIEQSDGELVVSETQFHIHAAGTNLNEAVTAFRSIFSGYLDVLTEEEHDLDDYMLAQLQFLRSYISRVRSGS